MNLPILRESPICMMRPSWTATTVAWAEVVRSTVRSAGAFGACAPAAVGEGAAEEPGVDFAVAAAAAGVVASTALRAGGGA